MPSMHLCQPGRCSRAHAEEQMPDGGMLDLPLTAVSSIAREVRCSLWVGAMLTWPAASRAPLAASQSSARDPPILQSRGGTSVNPRAHFPDQAHCMSCHMLRSA